MPLKQRKQIFQINVTDLRIPTGRRPWSRNWTQDCRETNPASGRVEVLNPGSPDYNTSALNHSATLPPMPLIGNLSKPRRQRRRQRRRERRQTKGLMRRTKAVHVRYKSLYNSLPFSAKQQREMDKFRAFWRTCARTANILDFPMELIAGITYLVWTGF